MKWYMVEHHTPTEMGRWGFKNKEQAILSVKMATKFLGMSEDTLERNSACGYLRLKNSDVVWRYIFDFDSGFFEFCGENKMESWHIIEMGENNEV